MGAEATMTGAGANPTHATGNGAAATGAGASLNHGMPPGMLLPPILTGIRLAINKLGPDVREPTYQVGELAWQRELGGDSTKGKVFQQEICGQQSLRVFGVMKEGSPIVHLLHSMAVYWNSIQGPAGLNGAVIGFEGDLDPYTPPDPRIVPDQKGWKWAKFVGCDDPVAMATFYNVAGNAGKLWTPDPIRRGNGPCQGCYCYRWS